MALKAEIWDLCLQISGTSPRFHRLSLAAGTSQASEPASTARVDPVM